MKKGFSLLQYSAAAALFIPAAAFSQAVYTDIDPDVVIDEPGENFGIDLDDDGLNDFNFIDKSYTTTVFYGDLANVKAIFAGAFDTMENGINGSYGFLSGGGGYTYYRPYVLPAGQMVNNEDIFYNDNYQTMVKEVYKFGTPLGPFHEGNWYSFDTDVLDQFLGFTFFDEAEVRRYGWIRCSVIDSGHTLIIHDYAYESKPDVGILTGDTVGDTTTVSISQLSLQANVYSFQKNIYISLPDISSAEISVYKLNGERLVARQMNTAQDIIDMSAFSTSIYLIIVVQKDKTFTKKIVLE